MSRGPEPDVKLVAFWPAAIGGGVEAIAIRFGLSLPEPFAVRTSSHAEPRLCVLAGYAGFALVSEQPAEDPIGAPERVWLSHLSRVPASAHTGGRRT